MRSLRSGLRLRLVTGALALLPAVAGAGGERPLVGVECSATDEKLVFHCRFEVTGKQSGKPMDTAAFKVDADMPSMPLAHNVKPVRPTPVANQPGTYQGHLELEMLGEWTLKLTFDEPVRDIVVKKLTFGRSAMGKDHGEMGHGDTKKGHSGHDD